MLSNWLTAPSRRFRNDTSNSRKASPISVQQSTEEQIVDVLVPPTRVKIGEVILPCPQEQISDRNGDQIVDVPGPQTRQKIGEVIQPTPQEKTSEVMKRIARFRTTTESELAESSDEAYSADESVDVPGPHVAKGKHEVVKTALAHQERAEVRMLREHYSATQLSH